MARAGASATGADATSAHMYICVGLRLSSADLDAVFFSAFWLRSSVVSVLISLISGILEIPVSILNEFFREATQ